MDEKDKRDFESLKRLHETVEQCIDFSKARNVEIEMHKQRGELLGIVDRLLASTAHDRKALDAYKKFGDLSDGMFGFGYNMLLSPAGLNGVFALHNGVRWRVSALMQANDRLTAENKDLKAEIEGENGLKKRNDRQAKMLGEYASDIDRLRRENGSLKSRATDDQRRISGLLATLDERNETIARKDALLIEKDKALKAKISPREPSRLIRYDSLPDYYAEITPSGWLCAGFTPISRVDGEIVSISTILADYHKAKSALRSTQEDVGELRVELADALETIDKLNSRLDFIVDIAEGEGDEIIGVDVGKPGGDETVIIVEIPGAWGFMHKPAKKE